MKFDKINLALYYVEWQSMRNVYVLLKCNCLLLLRFDYKLKYPRCEVLNYYNVQLLLLHIYQFQMNTFYFVFLLIIKKLWSKHEEHIFEAHQIYETFHEEKTKTDVMCKWKMKNYMRMYHFL